MECGNSTMGDNYNLYPHEEHMRNTHCYTDYYWEMQHRNDLNPREGATPLVVNGEHYIVHPYVPNPRNPKILGMGGHELSFRLQDGTILKSNDVWYQGPIPEHWRSRFPDNAKRVIQRTLESQPSGIAA